MIRFAAIAAMILMILGTVDAQNYLAPGFYDNEVPLITSSHTSVGTNAAYYAGDAYLYTGTTGFTFYFYGSEFALYGSKFSTAPDVQICIDAVCTTSTPYNPTQIFGEWYRMTVGTDPDWHQVVVTRMTTGQTGVMVLDAIEIQPYEITTTGGTVPAAHLIEQTFDYQGSTYTGVLDISISSGDLAIILLLLLLVIVQIGQMIRGMME